jgi:beta-1,4-N-acetylglucosaminyltransferase
VSAMTRRPEPARLDVLLVCSAGGHLMQLLALRSAWEGFSRLWVTDDAADTRSLLRGEPAVFGDAPSSRSPLGVVRNGARAVRLLRRHRPRVVITTGAAIAVPFAWIGRTFGAEVVYVESISRIDRPSLTLRLTAPVASRVYVQWPELVAAVARARFAGTVFSAR